MGAQAQQRDGLARAGERVGDDAAVGDGEGGDGTAVGDGQEDVAGERLRLVEGGKAGQGPGIDGPGGEEVERGGGHAHSVGTPDREVQRQ